MQGKNASEWYRALTLKERLCLLKRNQPPVIPPTAQARASERLGAWQNQYPFNQGDWFQKRLALEAVPMEAWLAAFAAESDEWPSLAKNSPDWLGFLAEAFEKKLNPSPLPSSGKAGGFLQGIQPLLDLGIHRLTRGLQRLMEEHPRAPFEPETAIAAMVKNLAPKLLTMVSRTLTLELHVSKLKGELAGATAEERFQSFVAGLVDRNRALSLLHEYPVLARQVVTAIENWRTVSLEVMRRLCRDRSNIRSHLGGPEPHDSLIEVKAGAGDSHCGGRSVAVLTFASGFRLVYKPRCLAVDHHFQQWLAWLNRRGANPDFGLMAVLDRGDHGWTAFIQARGCESRDQVSRFYQRLGGYLALFYVLEATDFHFENLIAAGAHPFPVDLEALFHPRSPTAEIAWADYRIADKMLGASVLRTGLLPFRIGETDENPGLDISGLASLEGAPTPEKVFQWRDTGTDEMRVQRRQMTMTGGQNRPTLKGKEIPLEDWADAIVVGFENTYDLLRAHTTELLAEDGPLAAFERVPVRAVLRPTKIYHKILFESYHPDLLRNALDRDQHFDWLWAGVVEQPYLQAVTRAETADLQQGDIPYFTAQPGARDLISSRGSILKDFFPETAMNLVRAKLSGLSEDGRKWQAWLIRASLGTLALSRDHLTWPSYSLPLPANSPRPRETTRRLLQTARALGDRLAAMALWDGPRVTWLGLTYYQQRWSLVPVMEDFYSGSPGIIFSLAYLAELTKHEGNRHLARAALATLEERLQHTRPEIKTIGAFQGWGGLIYAFTHLGVLWGDAGLLERASRMVEHVSSLIPQDRERDLIGGRAGCICALLAHFRVTKSRPSLAAALACGNALLAEAQPVEDGLAWPSRMSSTPLTGMSHGAAGMALALAELFAVTRDPRFSEAALKSCWYEIHRFSQARVKKQPASEPRPGEQQTLSVAWCYGAAGLGLALSRVLEVIPDPRLEKALEQTLIETRSKGFGKNHCLCHGDLGNMTLLLKRQTQSKMALWDADTRRRCAGILESLSREGWLCGTPRAVESPGLMNGLAGIAYGLLQLAAPERVPPVLTLAPPIFAP